MKTITKFAYLLLFAILSNQFLSAQEHQTKAEETHDKHHGMNGSHRLTIGIGQAHIFDGSIVGDNQWSVMPSWTFNYDYWVSNKWAIGLHNDLVLESFIIEDKEQKLLERNYPFAVVPVAIYKVGEHLALIGGVGAEFASTENLGLTRIGLEYGWHLPKKWELSMELVWDRKWDYYDSWGFSLTVSKLFSKK